MRVPTARGSTIRIFLVDGTPQGLRLVERMGWTGSALAFGRADYVEARARPEFGRTGVYVLLGPDPEGHRTQRVYVGEADEVRSRVDIHQKEKDFWTQGFVLTTKDDSLNKAHVRYLESRLLEIGRRADASTVDNGTAPPTPHLSEPEVADMEAFLDHALLLFPLVGVNVFEVLDDEPAAKESRPAAPGAAATSGDLAQQAGPPTKVARDPDFYLRTPLTDARGREDSRGFVVYEGARGRAETKVMIPAYKELRERLIQEGVLVPEGSEHLRLTKAMIFESPSAAASVLSGGSKNGRTEWKDAGGRTLKDHQEQSVT